MNELSQRDAIRIIGCLRNGTPPPIDLISHTHVGQERWLEGMCWYLDRVRDIDLSTVRFIKGEYGSGKTHFIRMTAHHALQRRLVISELMLSPEIRLDRFQTVWRELRRIIPYCKKS